MELAKLFRNKERECCVVLVNNCKYLHFLSLAVPGMDGGALTDTSLTDSYFSTSFIGVNGFGSPVETKYPLMQVLSHGLRLLPLLNCLGKRGDLKRQFGKLSVGGVRESFQGGVWAEMAVEGAEGR